MTLKDLQRLCQSNTRTDACGVCQLREICNKADEQFNCMMPLILNPDDDINGLFYEEDKAIWERHKDDVILW